MNSQNEIIQDFLAESLENLDELDRELVRLEKEPGSTESLSSIFRTIHTIKGTSSFLGFSHLESLTHEGENLLSRIREGQLHLNQDRTTALLDLMDAVRVMLASIEETETDGDEDYADLITTLLWLQDPDQGESTEPPGDDRESPDRSGSPVPTTSAEPDSDLSAASRAAPTAATGSTCAGGQAASAVTKPGPQNSGATTDLIAAPRVASTAATGSAGVRDQAVSSANQTTDSNAESETDLIAVPRAASIAARGGACAGDQVVSSRATTERVETRQHSGSSSDEGPRTSSSSTLRINVDLLDRLIDLVGELVLVRNQFVLQADQERRPEYTEICQRLSHITKDLQDSVIRTRMQSIDRIWSLVPRQVRDLGKECGKQVRVEIEGRETELDKSIIEAIKGPITHLIRNCVDHGLETPEARRVAGKRPEGCIRLNARHESGQVLIEVSDDGRGIDIGRIRRKALQRDLVSTDAADQLSERQWLEMIFDPGFTTKERVTSLSGRGVGLDVVRTNIESLSGSIEVQNRVGTGTTFFIKIPLTLAIIPALIVSEAECCYAIPQTNLTELVQLTPEQAAADVETVFGTDLFRLRGELMPLVRLADVLDVSDCRTATKSCRTSELVNIVVVDTGQHRFGLIVGRIRDTQEIVIKPLGRALRTLSVYSGATILGDGHMALIMDVAGIAQQTGLTMKSADSPVGSSRSHVPTQKNGETGSWLVVEADHQQQVIDIRHVLRLEDVYWSGIETAGPRSVLQYRGRILELLNPPASDPDRMTDSAVAHVVVITDGEREAGYVVSEVIDIEEMSTEHEDAVHGDCVVIRNRVASVIDARAALEAVS